MKIEWVTDDTMPDHMIQITRIKIVNINSHQKEEHSTTMRFSSVKAAVAELTLLHRGRHFVVTCNTDNKLNIDQALNEKADFDYGF